MRSSSHAAPRPRPVPGSSRRDPRPYLLYRLSRAPRLLGAVLALLALLPAPTAFAQEASGDPAARDLAAARALFEANLGAIAARDREAYLATYLRSDGLVRTGAEGFDLGYEGLAASAGEGWPEVFEARGLELTPLRPGLVYGTYRYRVTYGEEEVMGLSERLFVDTPEGWKIAVTTAFPALPGTPPPPLALVGATLVSGRPAAGEPFEGSSLHPPVADAVVVTAGGEVRCAGSREECPVPAGVDVVDVTGRWITPGLVDAHVHFAQTGWTDGRPDAVNAGRRHPYSEAMARLAAHPEVFGRSWLCSGVTAVFDVGGYPWSFDLAAGSDRDTRSPRVRATGPLVTTRDHWLNLPGERQFVLLEDERSGRRAVRWVDDRGGDGVKVWFIPTEEQSLEAAEELVRVVGDEAAERGLPLLVHATGLAEAKAALRSGAAVLVHSVWEQEVDEEFLDLARRAGAIYVPTLTVSRGYQSFYEAMLERRVPALDDPHGCVDGHTRGLWEQTAEMIDWFPEDQRPRADSIAARGERLDQQEARAAANLRAVHRAGIPVALGTDAGNVLTPHGPSVYGELEAMAAAGLSPEEVLVAATRGSALALGEEELLGTLEAGKAADLLVLGADPTASASAFREVRQVMRGGVLRSVAELAAPTAEGGESEEGEAEPDGDP